MSAEVQVPLPLAHPASSNPTHSVLFADLTIHDHAKHTTTAPCRVTMEIYSTDIGPKAGQYVEKFWLGTVTEKNLPFGFYQRSATRLVPGQSVHFVLVSEVAHCGTTELEELHKFGAAQSQHTSPHLEQYSIVVSLSKLKLGHNFEVKIILSENVARNTGDDVVIGKVIDGFDVLTAVAKVKAEATTQAPLNQIQIVECGQL